MTDDAHHSDAVLQAIEAGRKIEAIRLLREQTGLGLKEAKDEVDRLVRERRSDYAPMPEQGGAGALIKLAAIVLILLAIYRYFLAG